MEYEIIQLEAKTVAGLTARTNNQDEKMPAVIGGLWNDFFEKGIFDRLQVKANQKSIGLYSDYESDVMGDYSITVCCEMKEIKNIPQEAVMKKIAAGKYAKFIVRGHMQEAVGRFWQEFWKLDLERSYVSDFEEYQLGGTAEDMEIHMYIGIK